MDFVDKIKELSERVKKLRGQIQTEEATKNAFIMPLIQILEYDIFNPNEVIPEFVADIGVKKGEKVDYAIILNNQPAILIECKCCGDKLEKHDSQLYRYFSVTKARFAVLTDGVIYKFFTDLEESNKLDKKPFFIFNMLDFDDNQVSELKKFCKSAFDLVSILSTASELKYTREIKNVLNREYNNPSEEFVRFFASQIHDGRLTQTVIEKFTEITQKAFKQFVNELMNERFKSVISSSSEDSRPEEQEETQKEDSKSKIITTEEELEGYFIVKTILKNLIDTKRIAYRDTLSYFNVLLDDNNRKTICRLHFNTNQKYIGFIGNDKKELKNPIECLDDIYKYKEQLIEIAQKLNQ
ncbi:MAG: hypothetical protein A2104_10445 [Candidatus Melainabacteria bacterium GWF2_32_7]|nr:MAG: hypothetical protein A2104_10445 [Candidatus Melainabacteria bacterium GWF2_32_7]